MSSLNKVQIIGRLGKDPEVRNTENGSVANFSVAATESYKDKTTGEKKETTEWFSIVLWKGLADIAAKYLHKGDLVYIEGKLRTRFYEKDGTKRYVTEVVGHEMKMLTPKNTPTQSGTSHSEQEPAMVGADGTDDLPF